jgi:hypothetical protein
MRRVLSALERDGLLLKQDKALPSVVGLVTGQALTASWWGHPQAQLIFSILGALAECPDVLETKLCSGKVTFVSRALWPALLGVATSGGAWQVRGLSPAARRLLSAVARTGESEATGAAAKELEQRLLVRSAQRHTEAGRHVLSLESWQRWAKREAISPLSPLEGKRQLERAVQGLGAAPETLPWLRKGSHEGKTP